MQNQAYLFIMIWIFIWRMFFPVFSPIFFGCVQFTRLFIHQTRPRSRLLPTVVILDQTSNAFVWQLNKTAQKLDKNQIQIDCKLPFAWFCENFFHGTEMLAQITPCPQQTIHLEMVWSLPSPVQLCPGHVCAKKAFQELVLHCSRICLLPTLCILPLKIPTKCAILLTIPFRIKEYMTAKKTIPGESIGSVQM